MKAKKGKFEVAYGYGNYLGRIITIVFGAGLAAIGWHGYSNGVYWIFGYDQRTAGPVSTATLFYFVAGTAIIVFALLPWPRFKERRDDFHHHH